MVTNSMLAYQKVLQIKLAQIISFFLLCLISLVSQASDGKNKFDVETQLQRLEQGCADYQSLAVYGYLSDLKLNPEYTDYALYNSVDQLTWTKSLVENSCKAAFVTNTIEGMEYYRKAMTNGRFFHTAILKEGVARIMDGQLNATASPVGDSLINAYISQEMNEDDESEGLKYIRAAYGYIAAAQIVETQYSTDLLRKAARIAQEGFLKVELKYNVSIPYDIALLALSKRIEAGSKEYDQLLEQRIIALTVGSSKDSSTQDEIAIIHAELGRHALSMELISEISPESDVVATMMCHRLILDPRLNGLRGAEPKKFAALMSEKCYDITKSLNRYNCDTFHVFIRVSGKTPDWLDYFIIRECNDRAL